MKEEEYRTVLGLKKSFLIIIGIIALVIVFQTWSEEVSLEIGVLASIITFIYGFFTNSILNFIESKYISFKTNMSDFSANVQSLYNLVCLTNQHKFIEKMKSSIIEFLNRVQKTNPEHYELHQKNINSLYSKLKYYKPKTEKEKSSYQNMLSTLRYISVNRERMESFGDRYLEGENKFVLIFLTVLVILATLLVSSQHIVLGALGGAMVLGLVYTTHLMFSMDRMKYGESKILFKNINELKTQIKKLKRHKEY